jgi:hypothetical protein
VEGQVGTVHHKDDDNNHEIFIDSALLISLIARSTSKQAFLAYPQQRRFGWVLFFIALGGLMDINTMSTTTPRWASRLEY